MSGHIPRKRFGQNFLHEKRVIEKIVTAVDPQADDRLIEIGPGQGALTGMLLPHLNQMEAVELDRDLLPILERKFKTHSGFKLHNADALAFDIGDCFEGAGDLRIVGNLPYNISTPLLFHLLSFSGKIRDMHVMVQYEVAKRMAAAPGGGEYGRLSVMLQYFVDVKRLFDVPPGAFTPAPKVRSSIVRLTVRPPEVTVQNQKCFASLVASAFSHRRKTLLNATKGMVGAQDLEALGLPLNSRPQQLTVQDFVRLSHSVDVDTI